MQASAGSLYALTTCRVRPAGGELQRWRLIFRLKGCGRAFDMAGKPGQIAAGKNVKKARHAYSGGVQSIRKKRGLYN